MLHIFTSFITPFIHSFAVAATVAAGAGAPAAEATVPSPDAAPLVVTVDAERAMEEFHTPPTRADMAPDWLPPLNGDVSIYAVLPEPDDTDAGIVRALCEGDEARGLSHGAPSCARDEAAR